jgi:3-oxoacyl-[acyl-carrier-protein] synthase-3
MRSAGPHAVAVSFPPTIRGNDYFRARYPELVREVEGRQTTSPWHTSDGSSATRAFDEAMRRFERDPFRGTVERRVMAPGERILTYEARAARAALRASGVGPRDVDLLLVGSFVPDQIGVGNAPFLARELGVEGSAWNLESACATSVVGLEVACAMVATGRYPRVLLVTSCNYSQTVPEDSVLSWTVGDGAAAILVGEVPEDEGLLAAKSVHTASTCGTFRYALDVREGAPVIAMKAAPDAARILRETSEDYVRRCCLGACAEAGLDLASVGAFVSNTPTAWFRDFAAEALGIDRSRTVDAYPRYANVGPVLAPANLALAARTGLLVRGEPVLMFGVGSVSSAAALVLRWGEVAFDILET